MKSDLFILMFGKVPAQPTGLANSVIRRSKVLAQKGIKTEILVEDFDIDFKNNIKQLRKQKEILDLTNVRNLYFDLSGDSSEESNEKDKLKELIEAHYVLVPDQEKPHVFRAFKNGLYEMFIWLKDGKVYFIDYLTPTFKRTKREWYDCDGNVKKIEYMNDANTPIREVYLNLRGEAYLSILLDNKTKKEKQILLFNGNSFVQEFSNKKQLFKYWLTNKVLNKDSSNILISEYGFNLEILSQIEREMKLKVIYTLHNNHFDSPYTFGSNIRKELKPFFNKIDEIENLVVLTKEQQNDIMLQFNKANVTVIPHHVSKNNIKISKDNQKIVMLGRFEKVKGMDDGIKAFKEVLKTIPNAKLEIYGRGSLEQEYRKIIEENKMEDNVTIKGFVNNSYEVFSTAIASLIPSQYEGICLSMMESMACGCIPIAYDFKYGAKDLINNFENGLIVEKNNIQELACCMIKVLTDNEFATKLSKNTMKIVEIFNEEKLYNDWMNLLNKLDNEFE